MAHTDQVVALNRERLGYKNRGLGDRVKQVESEIKKAKGKVFTQKDWDALEAPAEAEAEAEDEGELETADATPEKSAR